MKKKIFYLPLFLTLMGASYYLVNHNEFLKTSIQKRFESGNFRTLEIRYSAEAIMEMHRHSLLKDETHSFLAPELQFYPYLLMEIKYSKSDDTTGEGLILWGMHDGEMVTSTANWEKSHGFEDCINAHVDKNDFKILNAIAGHGGLISRKNLGEDIHVEPDILDRWIESCRKKKLVVQSGNHYRLHFQSPRLQIQPETLLEHWLVTQPYKNAHREPQKYSRRQIETIANLAFDQDFTIRRISEIFLPVYRIDVQNPDGSIYTTYWNALNGKKFDNLNINYSGS